MIVGEIGIPRQEFLYDIQFWEARRIIKGYNARYCNMWSATRWQTFKIMTAQVGTDALKKIGINNPSDLLPFPWDKEPAPPLSDEERNELKAEMDAINAALPESQSKKKG